LDRIYRIIFFIFLNFLPAGAFYRGEVLTKTEVPLTLDDDPMKLKNLNRFAETSINAPFCAGSGFIFTGVNFQLHGAGELKANGGYFECCPLFKVTNCDLKESCSLTGMMAFVLFRKSADNGCRLFVLIFG
jgi:hypothetical protein